MTGPTDGDQGRHSRRNDSAPQADAPGTRPSAGCAPRVQLTPQLWFGAQLAAAHSEVLVFDKLRRPPDNPISIFRPIDRANVRRGVRYRMLVPDYALDAPDAARQLHELASLGAEVRTAPEIPIAAMVLDGTTAVLPGDDGQDDIVVFQLPAVVHTTARLFEQLWRPAMPLPIGDGTRYVEPKDRERELLALLCMGYTDASAAARLGVSMRTVRRMVAGIMHRLDAHSRFQAGAKAADRGWIEQWAG